MTIVVSGKKVSQLTTITNPDNNALVYVSNLGTDRRITWSNMIADFKGDLFPAGGTDGQVLTTNGAGVYSWTTVSGGGGLVNLIDSGSNVLNSGSGTGFFQWENTRLNSGGGTSTISTESGDTLKLSPSGTLWLDKSSVTFGDEGTSGLNYLGSANHNNLLTGATGGTTPYGGFLRANNSDTESNRFLFLQSGTTTDENYGANIKLYGQTFTDTGLRGSVYINPSSNGYAYIDGLRYPSTDGTSGQALITNGSGVLSFSSISGSAASGTYTPTISTGAGGESITYTTQQGFYQTIGDYVDVWIYIVVNTLSGGSGPWRISLPFTKISGSEAKSIGSVALQGVNFVSGYNYYTPQINSFVNYCEIVGYADGSGITAALQTGGSGTIISGSGIAINIKYKYQ
jgi:hypothetical protein